MEKKIKLDDVARLAGVSKATASRVLNHRGYLSQKTIDKVHQAMEDLNYRPNAIARQLYKQETMLVGLIFPRPSITPTLPSWRRPLKSASTTRATGR